MITDKFCFAVRKNIKTNKWWVDINTWGYEKITSQEKANKPNEKLPDFAEKNPVIRISYFSMEEI